MAPKLRTKQRPINGFAERLLARYYINKAFWAAVRDGAGIDWAGIRVLGCRPEQSRSIHGEIREASFLYDRDPPLAWLRREVTEAIRLEKMSRGRETKCSGVATALFNALMGDERTLVDFDVALLREGDPEEIRRHFGDYIFQCAEYRVFANLNDDDPGQP
jgi:hypothetical protein